MFAANQSDLTPAQRAHTRRIIWLLVAYAVILPPLVWVHAHLQTAPTLSVIMAIAACIPVLGIFASWGRYVSDEKDEYHQAMTLRRIAVATNATMGAAVVWGFLQAFGVVPLFETYWVPLAWVAIQGVGACIATMSRREPRA